MSPSAYPPCSRCGGPRQKEDFQGASVVACLNCGAVTLSRGDLQRLAGVMPMAPPPAPVGRTIVPDAISSLDIGKPVLTASEPPPPPRSKNPTLSPSPAPEIPREIEYFHGPGGSQQVNVPNATIAPEDFATEEEEETNLFSGDMAKALEADFANPAFEETMIPPTQATFNQFDEMPDQDDDTAEQLGMEVSLQKASPSPDPEPLLPGNRSIPDTDENVGLNMSFDEPFGGEDFDDEDEDDFVAQYQAARRRRMILGMVVVAMLGLALGAPVVGFVGYQAFRASMASADVAPGDDPAAPSTDGTADGDTDEPQGEGDTDKPEGDTDTEEPVEAPPSDEPPAPDEPPAKPADPPPADNSPPPAETPPDNGGAGASPSKLIDQGWGKVGSDPAAAAALFEQALQTDPSNADANYGLGYALLQGGDTGGAKVYLCKSLQNANTSTQREVNGLLTNNEMTCD